ncbi:MAG: sulfatase-like hydrolase/transferase [Ardenticatenaceae bacterium]|nr:sulfatase-like hydrolase/transferase [Ardenticatenaceae bacterium]
MTNLSRRDFLKFLPAASLPLMKVSWPYIASALKTQQPDPSRPNICVLVFDTLSAKHVSLYGYDRETTPNIARIADRATVFHNHRAGANFTSPGTASLLTGTYSWSHRAFHLHGLVEERFTEQNMFSLLPDDYYKAAYTHNLLVMSLLHQFRGDLDLFKKTRELCLADLQFADRLFFQDYSPAFWSEWLFLRGGETPPASLFLSMVDKGRRFASKRQITQGYADLFPRGIPNLHSLFFVLEDAINWLEEQVKSLPQPFFGYFHLLPPHEPYTTRRDFVDIFVGDGLKPPDKGDHFASQGNNQTYLNNQRREYDEYLAYADAELGILFDSLEASGALDNTYFVLTSDHGEMFERGIRGHVTTTLFDPLLHVPLLIVKPGQQTREDVYTNTSCVDLLPTFLHLTGQPIPDWAEGQVLPTFAAAEPAQDRSIFALEAKSNPKQAPLHKATATLIKDDYKLIYYTGLAKGDVYELYHVADDAEELTNLYETKPAIAADLQAELAQKLDEVNEPYQR